MIPPDDLLYEYALVRYVPRIDRQEFINIGLIMLCKRRRWLHGEICFDEKRIRAFDPHVKIENLKKQASIFEIKDIPFANIPVEEKYRWLTATKSAVLQTSESHPGLCVAPITLEKCGDNQQLYDEFYRLFSELVII